MKSTAPRRPWTGRRTVRPRSPEGGLPAIASNGPFQDSYLDQPIPLGDELMEELAKRIPSTGNRPVFGELLNHYGYLPANEMMIQSRRRHYEALSEAYLFYLVAKSSPDPDGYVRALEEFPDWTVEDKAQRARPRKPAKGGPFEARVLRALINYDNGPDGKEARRLVERDKCVLLELDRRKVLPSQVVAHLQLPSNGLDALAKAWRAHQRAKRGEDDDRGPGGRSHRAARALSRGSRFDDMPEFADDTASDKGSRIATPNQNVPDGLGEASSDLGNGAGRSAAAVMVNSPAVRPRAVRTSPDELRADLKADLERGPAEVEPVTLYPGRTLARLVVDCCDINNELVSWELCQFYIESTGQIDPIAAAAPEWVARLVASPHGRGSPTKLRALGSRKYAQA